MARWQNQDGTVAAFVAVIAVGLIAAAGLAYDGGQIINATAAANDAAAAAARAGAQQVDPAAAHAGTTALDPIAAQAAAESFLDAAGASGTVTVAGSTVTVTVTASQPMRILPLPDRTIAATASATAISDVLGDVP